VGPTESHDVFFLRENLLIADRSETLHRPIHIVCWAGSLLRKVTARKITCSALPWKLLADFTTKSLQNAMGINNMKLVKLLPINM
jgi:hypothetical protein